MKTSPIPLPVERTLCGVGENIALARRRRQLSQEALAERIGASVSTVRRMEDGHTGTALQYFARAFQVFGELDTFEKIMDTARDSVGLTIMDEQLPQRVRSPRKPHEPSGF
jgi:ribosome-binding protein aMBF1 (putative translation factor)